jgi:hypothetical protein
MCSRWPYFFLSDSCRFVDVGRPLWREDWSVIYCTNASGPCQSSHSRLQVPQNSWPYFTVLFETPPTWRAKKRMTQFIPLDTGLPFRHLLRLQDWSKSKSKSKSKPKLYYDRGSVGQSVLVSGSHRDPRPIFLLFFYYFLDGYGFVDVVRPLWREAGSVVFSCCWASPVQSFKGPSSAGLMTECYCLCFWDSPTWRAKLLYLNWSFSNLKLYCDRWSVGQSVLVSGPNLGPMTRYLLVGHCGLHVAGQSPWREDGSVIYSYNSHSPTDATWSAWRIPTAVFSIS